jgi:hypothetical protein
LHHAGLAATSRHLAHLRARNKKAKERIKLEAEAANLSKNIEEMVKSKEVYMDKALQLKIVMADKENAINQARWKEIRENDKRRQPWMREDSR